MDNVRAPKHYIGLKGLEVEEVLRNFIPKYNDGYLAHRLSAVIEYILRAPEKNNLEDLEKAAFCLDMAIRYIREPEEDEEEDMDLTDNWQDPLFDEHYDKED